MMVTSCDYCTTCKMKIYEPVLTIHTVYLNGMSSNKVSCDNCTKYLAKIIQVPQVDMHQIVNC
jgi:hypothetical protein